ncbi:hypothetical protein N9J68_03155 [Gammaproteobacteria bacterium]|nr:hypothetical protein [Gammaproteobacteria bacterium]MDA9011223.1 hypothetical protein [Gammaproteobacteria bacterium]MDA9118144.1 hypothetical protein [Gammaproteobacteria bacterium]
MIQSVRQRKKKQKNLLGMIGIISILGFAGFGFYFYDSNSDPLDANNCSIKNGPNAVTAIIFDKSQKYSIEQVTDIKTSFNLWLSGKEPNTKNRRVALDFFEEGNLIQLYVTDQKAVDTPDGLTPLAELCVPKDFQTANKWIENPEFLKEDYNKFITEFSTAIESLLEASEGRSPIMETFIRISNSENFQKHPNKKHNMFIVSDMLQNSDNYSHYWKGIDATNWDTFEEKMTGTVYMRPRLNGVQWQVYYAKRSELRERELQTIKLSNFWERFFDRGGAVKRDWVLIDG